MSWPLSGALPLKVTHTMILTRTSQDSVSFERVDTGQDDIDQIDATNVGTTDKIVSFRTSVRLPESACRGYRHPLGVRIIVVLRIDLRLVTNVCAFGDRACDAGGVGIENCVTARIDNNDTGSRKIQS